MLFMLCRMHVQLNTGALAENEALRRALADIQAKYSGSANGDAARLSFDFSSTPREGTSDSASTDSSGALSAVKPVSEAHASGAAAAVAHHRSEPSKSAKAVGTSSSISPKHSPADTAAASAKPKRPSVDSLSADLAVLQLPVHLVAKSRTACMQHNTEDLDRSVCAQIFGVCHASALV